MRLLRIVRLVAFLFPGRKFRTSIRTLCRKMFKDLESFKKEVVVDGPSKDNATVVLNFLVVTKNISTRNH
jgi:hypothetical protein